MVHDNHFSHASSLPLTVTIAPPLSLAQIIPSFRQPRGLHYSMSMPLSHTVMLRPKTTMHSANSTNAGTSMSAFKSITSTSLSVISTCVQHLNLIHHLHCCLHPHLSPPSTPSVCITSIHVHHLHLCPPPPSMSVSSIHKYCICPHPLPPPVSVASTHVLLPATHVCCLHLCPIACHPHLSPPPVSVTSTCVLLPASHAHHLNRILDIHPHPSPPPTSVTSTYIFHTSSPLPRSLSHAPSPLPTVTLASHLSLTQIIPGYVVMCIMSVAYC